MTDTKPGKKITPSVYVTGFCGIGNHEGTKNLSPSGKPMPACNLGGRADAGRLGVMECSCECHSTTRMMEEMTGVKVPSREINRQQPSLGRLLHELADGADNGRTGGSVDPSRASVVTSSGARFAATASGFMAKGQLEDEVRHAVNKQIAAAGAEMISILGLTTKTLSMLISTEKPPSVGAIYSVLSRWDKKGLVVLEQNPLRFVKYTDKGKRDLGG